MKFFVSILLASFILLDYSATAQDSLPDASYTLIASNEATEYRIEPGSRVVVRHTGQAGVTRSRGFFIGGINGKLAIAPRKNAPYVLVDAADITSIRKINPGRRRWMAIAGGLLVAGGAAILDQSSGPGKAMASAVVIPFIGAGSYLLAAVPATLVMEKAREKKRSSGWVFRLQAINL